MAQLDTDFFMWYNIVRGGGEMKHQEIVDGAMSMFVSGASPELLKIDELPSPVKGIVVTVVSQEAVDVGKSLFFSYREMYQYVENEVLFTPAMTEEELVYKLFDALVYEIENWGIGMNPNVLSQEV